MTKRIYDQEAEAQWIDAYHRTLQVQQAALVVADLRCACRVFREIHPNQSLLNHAHTTEWCRPWRDAQRPRYRLSTLAIRLCRVRRWLSWLFSSSEIDDNALAYCQVKNLLEGTETALILRCNLQRSIADYLSAPGPVSASTRLNYRIRLDAFNVFINRRLESDESEYPIGEETIIAWIRELPSQHTETAVTVLVNIVNGFLEFLVTSGRLGAQALAQLLARQEGNTRHQRLKSFLRGAPEPRRRHMPFASSLGPHLAAYLRLMRAVGRRYVTAEAILRQFDQFFAQGSRTDIVITRSVVNDWLASNPSLSAASKRGRISCVRQFCRYMARIEPRTWIPDRSVAPARVPYFRPHVFTAGQVRDLVAATGSLSADRWPLLPQTFRVLILLLYATGLRISEALRLSIRDIDLRGHTLFIADTKFFKSRCVPFSASLAAELDNYLVTRTHMIASARATDPFFISRLRKPYSYSRASKVFRRLVRQAAIMSSGRRPGMPRIHDLRRTFAVHALARWYRSGVDVQCRLPLLATYMGHSTVEATQVYLVATAEIIQDASRRFEHEFGDLLQPDTKEDHDGNAERAR